MNKFLRATLAVTAIASIIPTTALAHSAMNPTDGLAHGFVHPISGLDHVLAMVMVGVCAYQINGRAVWLLPTTFLAAMAFGGALGMEGLPAPFVEIIIAGSVIALGAIIAFPVKAPMAVLAAIAGIFAFFHGLAHGTEMPAHFQGFMYAVGFLIGTASLHAAGVAFGFSLKKAGPDFFPAIMRTSAGVASCTGIALLAGLI